MKHGMLEEYVIDKKEQKMVNGNVCEIITYKGDHCDEYLVREVKSGKCSLFYKGILQLSWVEADECHQGELVVNLESGLVLDEEKEFSNQLHCGSIKKEVKHTYLELYEFDGLRGIREGIVEKSSDMLVQVSLYRVVKVNVETHELLSVNGENVCGVEHNQVLNLSDEGDRWEGDVLHDEPYGWGVLYDKEGEMAYEGFRIGDVSVCYGTQYYADIQKVEYEGEWCEGKRWGRGIQYDRNGIVVYDGEWMNDDHVEKRFVLNDGMQVLHNHIEELIVSYKSCNGIEWIGLDLLCMPHLRLFEVGDECFEHVTEVKLIGLHALERAVIGKHCFRNSFSNDPNPYFYLKDCEKLKELKIGCKSFRDYSVCEIEYVPSLEVIEMGELNEESTNFFYASLELKSDGDGMT